jgi:hypothetical protein
MLLRKTARNIHGETVWADPIEVPCGVVHLKKTVQKSSVRTDSSASRGNAEEIVVSAKILFPVYVEIEQGDRFEIMGFRLEAINIEPRNNVRGEHDHNEADFRISVP